MAKAGLGFALLLLLAISASQAAATPPTIEPVKWTEVSIPTEGEPGNWVLAAGADPQHLTLAADGTLYCYATPSSTNLTLFRSTAGGAGWSTVGKVRDAITDIASVPDNASILYYATTSTVHRSIDGGLSFNPLPPGPGGAGTGNITITSLAVARADGRNLVAVATRDGDAGQFGGVYLLDEKDVLPTWLDTGAGSYDAGSVAFSPRFATDRALVAVLSDERDTILRTRVGERGWGAAITDARIKDLVPVSACIAFPADYDARAGECAVFIGVDTGTGKGDVYRCNTAPPPNISSARDLDAAIQYGLANTDIASLAVSGNTLSARLLAGAAASAEVYRSNDGGSTWKRGTKRPTGQARTAVLMLGDFAATGAAYAATSGSDSAVSVTRDGGLSWNQAGLVDTAIATGNILDVAVSPRYAGDGTLYMLTFGTVHSLWRTSNGGASWERVLSGSLPGIESLKGVRLPPDYGRDKPALYVAGTGYGGPMLWQSPDNGQTFTPRNAPAAVDGWATAAGDTLFLAVYDGAQSLVHRTSDGGITYSTGSVVGGQPVRSLALSPAYPRDRTLLAATSNDGNVYLSSDAAVTFKRLGQTLPRLIAETGAVNDVTVTFSPGFSAGGAIYAASHCSRTTQHISAVYRLNLGTTGTAWESIHTSLPAGSILGQVAASSGGALYAANVKAGGGLERCLNPAYPLGPTFETVTRGLGDNATLVGLWTSGDQLWTVDTRNTRLMTYLDTLTQPVRPAAPADRAPGIGTVTGDGVMGVSLKWETVPGATGYKWQLNHDDSFGAIPPGFEGDTTGASAKLPVLEPHTTYYWRVRVTQPVLGPWSEKWRFTTALGEVVVAPQLVSPQAGSTAVPLRPSFQWSPIGGADRYELLLAADPAFEAPLIARTQDQSLPATAWQCQPALDYATTYFWKVRAANSASSSAWSAVGAFTTLPAPAPPATFTTPPPAPGTPTPTPVTQPALPNWALFIGVGLLAVIAVLLLVIVILLLKTRLS